MKKKYIDRAMDIGDGLASLMHKKVSTFMSELAKEGVLTAKEEVKLKKRLDGMKNNVYNAVSKELRALTESLFEKSEENKKGATKKSAGRKK